MRNFITGSQAYGEPTDQSDVDLVLLVDADTAELLTTLSETGKSPVRFGRLNLILCTSEEEYAVWLIGTQHLAMQDDTSSSKEAKRVFDQLRTMVDLRDKADSKRTKGE